ncbi:MAG: ATP-binding protein [Breznakibacter sp.]
MAFKHFNTRMGLYIALVVANSVALGVVGVQYGWGYALTTLLLAEMALVAGLVRFFGQTNRQISFFIQAVKNDDTSLRFPVQTGNPVIDELHNSLNELNQVVQETKIRSRIKEQYFGEILKHIGTAVVVFNQRGFVVLTNQAALDLFGLQVFTHLSQIDKTDPRFKADLLAFSHTQAQPLVLCRQQQKIPLSVRSTVLHLKDEQLKMVTLQDIRGELERKELDSWVKLIKVMNHEIMNSLAPVTSIAQSLKDIWQAHASSTTQDDEGPEVKRTVNGLDVIVERGEALMRFVESYRLFSRMPDLHLTPVSMQALFDRLSILVSPLKEQFSISIVFKSPDPDFTVMVDEHLMVQVVVNLVKNAAEALVSTPYGHVQVGCVPNPAGQCDISVTDNGPGIAPELMDEIFIPFFTTKQSGSGIGLSYSRQILRAHSGSVLCRSVPGRTTFVVSW